MLKRFSSLILVLMVGGSVLAGTAQVSSEHVCKMAGMEMMPGMETMPCCEDEQAEGTAAQYGTMEMCCVTIPRAPGSGGTTFKLRPPSFSVAVIHPAIVQSALILPKPYERPATEVFLPNLQAIYIRNLSLLI